MVPGEPDQPPDDAGWLTPAVPAEDRLDDLRIKQLVQAQRATQRLRSYWIIGIVCVLIVAAQVIFDCLRAK